MSLDHRVFIPAREDFVAGKLYYGSNVLLAFGLAAAPVDDSVSKILPLAFVGFFFSKRRMEPVRRFINFQPILKQEFCFFDYRVVRINLLA